MTAKKIGIKLRSKSLKMDSETFQPYLWVTVGIPLEAATDKISEYGEATVYEAIGRELAELVTKA